MVPPPRSTSRRSGWGNIPRQQRQPANSECELSASNMLCGSPRPRTYCSADLARRSSSENLFWPCSCQLRRGDRRYGAASFPHDSHGLGDIYGCRGPRGGGVAGMSGRIGTGARGGEPPRSAGEPRALPSVASPTVPWRLAKRRSSAVSRAARVSSRWRRWVAVSRHRAIGVWLGIADLSSAACRSARSRSRGGRTSADHPARRARPRAEPRVDWRAARHGGSAGRALVGGRRSAGEREGNPMSIEVLASDGSRACAATGRRC
jgi:hypothetical protein